MPPTRWDFSSSTMALGELTCKRPCRWTNSSTPILSTHNSTSRTHSLATSSAPATPCSSTSTRWTRLRRIHKWQPTTLSSPRTTHATARAMATRKCGATKQPRAWKDQATMPASPMVLKVATVCTGVTRSSSRGRKLLPLMKRIKSKPSTTRNTKKATSRLRLV